MHMCDSRANYINSPTPHPPPPPVQFMLAKMRMAWGGTLPVARETSFRWVRGEEVGEGGPVRRRAGGFQAREERSMQWAFACGGALVWDPLSTPGWCPQPPPPSPLPCRSGGLNVGLRELLGHCMALEEIYLEETARMAISIDEVGRLPVRWVPSPPPPCCDP